MSPPTPCPTDPAAPALDPTARGTRLRPTLSAPRPLPALCLCGKPDALATASLTHSHPFPALHSLLATPLGPTRHRRLATPTHTV